MTPSLQDRLAAASKTLASVGQEQVLAFFDQASPAGQEKLLAQIEGIDWPEVARLVESHVKNKPKFELPPNVAPAPWYPYTPPAELKGKYDTARRLGEELLRQGKVAAFTVAGGQGTRLGWDGPKGTFPATAIRKTTLFGCMAEYIRNAQVRYGRAIPWYIMTSPINDADTRAYFDKNNYLGLARDNVSFFPQAMMPALDMQTGKVLLEAPDSMALSPNGHGGSLKALWTSGAIADMKNRGVEQISYTQVDNPIVRIVDAQFLGLHALDNAQMSSKMLPKREPLEKLGNFCLVDGKMTVIEYSDLPDTLAHERVSNGELRFRAGSIAIHVIRVDFVESLNRGGRFSLPFHRAEKKVPFIDIAGGGKAIKPEKNNAVKLETFVFDALPMTDRSIVYETDRLDEFAPIKNAAAPGVLDSPATSIELQSERSAKWLEAAGVKVPRKAGKADAVIEVSQLTAIYPEDLKQAKLPAEIKPGEQLLL